MSEPAVEIKNLSKTYTDRFGRHATEAVKNLSLTVETGSVMGLIGPNGAGKTTTIYCMLGLLMPDRGNISIFGENPDNRETRKYIGFQSEIFHTYNFLKPKTALKFYGRLSGMSGAHLDNRIDFYLEQLGLENAKNQKVSSFSKGMKQRLGIAQALLHDPNLLILDEPFTGLDPQGRKLITDIILEEKREGKTVFFSSHILSDIERICDDVTMMKDGEVAFTKDIDSITAKDNFWIVKITGWSDEYKNDLKELIQELNVEEEATTIVCRAEDKDRLLKELLQRSTDIIGVQPKSWTLEEQYMEMDRETGVENE